MGRRQQKIREPGIQRAIDMCGGPAGLARKIGGVTQQAVSQWTRCPGKRIADVASATGIPREELRPDLYAPGHTQTNERPPLSNTHGEFPDNAPDRTFSRFFHLRRADFASAEEIDAHVDALREEWSRR